MKRLPKKAKTYGPASWALSAGLAYVGPHPGWYSASLTAVGRAMGRKAPVSTAAAVRFAYCRKYLLRGRWPDPQDYRIARKALELIANPVGRAGGHGRPILWRRDSYTERYARVSTRDQDLASQIAELQTAGCGNIFKEKASGAKTDRPPRSDCWLGPAVHQAKWESLCRDRAENDFAIVRVVARVVPLCAVNKKLKER
jgi:hypothetical protein